MLVSKLLSLINASEGCLAVVGITGIKLKDLDLRQMIACGKLGAVGMVLECDGLT